MHVFKTDRDVTYQDPSTIPLISTFQSEEELYPHLLKNLKTSDAATAAAEDTFNFSIDNSKLLCAINKFTSQISLSTS
jgi:hypothetical protein